MDEPNFVLAGKLAREYLLPPGGPARLDSPGGNLLYAAGGLAIWGEHPGLIARVGEDYPRSWLKMFETRGYDTRGIQILPGPLDLRSFCAYSESWQAYYNNPVSHFAARGLPFPKSLLGYQPDAKGSEDQTAPTSQELRLSDIPPAYLSASVVHLCSLNFVTQTQLISAFKGGAANTFSVDPSPHYMQPPFLDLLRTLLKGLTAFFPTDEDLFTLFRGQTHDLWEMAEELGNFGCEFIIIKCGERGQMLYDAVGKRRWQVPAYPARLVDPTGAGDAFCGGFLAGYRRTYDPLQAVLYGNVSASLTVEGPGAFYALDVVPGLAEARRQSLANMVLEM